MTVVQIDAIQVNGRHRRDLGDIGALAESIGDVGLLQPPVVTTDLKLVAGERRLAALQKLGRTETRVITIANLADAGALLRAERDENVQRKEMTPSEKVALAEALREIMRAEAKERQRDAGREHGRGIASENFTEANQAPVRDRLGEMVGMSGPTYARARDVVRASEDEDPELRQIGEQAREEMDRTGKVTPAFDKVAEAKGIKTAYDGKSKKAAEQKLNGKSREAMAAKEERAREMAEAGYTSRQVADALGYKSQAGFKRFASAAAIEFPADKFTAKTRHHDSMRIARETVFAIQGAATGLDLIDYGDIETSEAAEWATSLTESLREINRFVKKIKEMAHGHEQE